MSSFISDLIRVGFSRVLIIAVSLMSSIITARYLGPENNGIIAALLVYPSLFMTIGSLGIRQSTTYFLGKNIHSEEDIKTAITQIWFFTTVISVLTCFVLMRFFSKSGDNAAFVWLALLPIPFNLFVTYNSGIFLGKNQIKEFNRVNWLPNLLTLVLTAVLVIIFKMGVSGALIAMIGGPLVMFFLMLVRNNFLNSFNLNFKWDIVKGMLSLGVTYAVALLIINLNYRVDVIILDHLSTPYEMGIYAKGASITQYLWQIPMILSTLVFSRSATSKDDLAFSYKVAHLLRLSIIAIGLMAATLYVFSGFVIEAMYGEAFAPSAGVLRILLPGVLVLTIFKVMNMDLAGKGKPWVSMKAMVPGLLVNVGLNIVLIPHYGSVGASISSTVSYSVAGALFLYFYSRETGLPIREIVAFSRRDFDPILKFIKKKKA